MVILEIAPGVYARHVRQAIVRVMDPATPKSDELTPGDESTATTSDDPSTSKDKPTS